MELAHLLPLGDEAARHELLEQASLRGLSDDVRRERELILRTGGFLAQEWTDVLRAMGNDAEARGDYTAAADLWERAYLDLLGMKVTFVEPWANVMVPAMIQRARARGLMRSGDAAGAFARRSFAWR